MKIARVLKSNYAIRYEQGEKIRDRIIKALYHGRRITLDCGGLVIISMHFIYPISDLVLLYPKETLKNSVRFTNISRFHAELIRKCITNTIETNNQ